VVGVGGAGGNAVNNMIRSNFGSAANSWSATPTRRRSCNRAHRGKNPDGDRRHPRARRRLHAPDCRAGLRPRRRSTTILEAMGGSNMVFITAGMGRGDRHRGVLRSSQRIARESGILTVGVVTKPFSFSRAAIGCAAPRPGIEELQKFVDTLIIIPNQKPVFRIANEAHDLCPIAFQNGPNDVLHSGGARGH